MRRAALLCAAALLASCATTRLDAGKTLATTWAALDAASQGAELAVQSGKLHGAPAALVSADLKKASSALDTATTVYNAAGGDPSAQIAVAAAAIAEINTVLQAAQ